MLDPIMLIADERTIFPFPARIAKHQKEITSSFSPLLPHFVAKKGQNLQIIAKLKIQ
jgi:hypothetical protein